MSTITEKYAELKSQGFVPTPDTPIIELPLPDFVGRSFTFNTAGGPVTIFWHPNIGAFEVYGAILASYVSQGGPQGALGYPVSGEYDDVIGTNAVGRISDFERGSISWYRATSEVTTSLTGPIAGNTSFEAVDGIDVSHYQGTIDWTRVAGRGTADNERIAFAYIKATDGDHGRDDKFKANWVNSQGRLPRGAYHYFYPQSRPDQTWAQVENFMSFVQSVGGPGELPPVVDIEALPGGISVDQATASLQFFLSHIEQAFGIRPLIYTFPTFWRAQMRDSRAFSNGYKLWIAHYGRGLGNNRFARRSTGPIIPGGWSQFSMWQHSIDSGVEGITGPVDRDSVLVPPGMTLRSYLA